MAGIRKEDLIMKIPALLRLSRLGYVWLPRGERRTDRDTNILPDVLACALERINGRALPPEDLARLMASLRDLLDLPDLGFAFYRTLRDGWEGWRLLDASHPRRNLFHMASELPCVRGSLRFRPDITLFVNGLPLAMIEVKTGDVPKGIRAEYDRMRCRFRAGAFRRFLQCAQIWVFSDGRPTSEDRLLPQEGSFYATGAESDFPVRSFREKRPGSLDRLPPADPETVRAILSAHGLSRLPRGFRAAASGKELFPLLDGLFAPERFLFLLRYGIHYVPEPGDAGSQVRAKRLLASEQFFALWDLHGKLNRGFRSSVLFQGGAAGGPAFISALVSLLRDLKPDAVFCLPSLTDVPSSLRDQIRAALAEPGNLPAGRPGSLRLLSPDMLTPPRLRAFCAESASSERIYFLSEGEGDYGRRAPLARRLLRSDPRCAVITLRSRISREGSNYTYLLECADGTYYCGWTNDLDRRVRSHNEGRGAKYTRSRRPVRLVYSERFATREEAMSREWHLKRLSRAEKEKLIQKGKAE